jgi:hypothetical protein
MTIHVGIDPGLSGAIAAIHPNGTVSLRDIPTRPMEIAGLGKKRIDVRATVIVLRALVPADEACAVWIERVGIQRSSGNAIQSVGSLCGTVVGLLGALDVMRLQATQVDAAAWTKRYGLRRAKGESAAAWKARHRETALKLYPDADIRLAKHDGRADALLIAHHGKAIS